MLKVLYFDIETSPNLGFIWGKYEQNVIAYVAEWDLIGFAYAWGDGRVQSMYPSKMAGPATILDNEGEIVRAAHELFDEADVVIAHNGDKFDIKKSNTKFIQYEMLPPTPVLSIDTLKIARQTFAFNSNKLDDLGEYLGLGKKMKHAGFDMWMGCMNGEQKYYTMMNKYNKQDVNLLRKVYKRLRPWMKNHPNMLTDESQVSCVKCASIRLTRRGCKRTPGGITYQQWQCKDCGGYSRSRTMCTKAGNLVSS